MSRKVIELQRPIDQSTVIVGDFDNPFPEMVRASRQRTSKDIVELTTTINHQDIIDIYRLLHPTTAGYTFFSSSHGTFAKADHIPGQEQTLTNLKE